MLMTMTTKKLKREAIDGILLINKPQGLTSNQVLQQVKWLFNAKKAGHTGSLDPLATGMLPICFGEATKFSQYLLNADKCYEVKAQLGIRTDSADATGHIISTREDFAVSVAQIEAVLKQFTGVIHQIPSMFSALKHQGVPLYKLARAGKTVERPARKLTINEIIFHELKEKTIALSVNCSKGTYIRNLIDDIGEALGVGAHVTALHRTYTAGFSDDNMYSIEALRAMSVNERTASLLPIDRAVNSLPSIHVDTQQRHALQQGRSVLFMFAEHPITGLVRLYDSEHHFFGLGEINAEALLKPQRLLAY